MKKISFSAAVISILLTAACENGHHAATSDHSRGWEVYGGSNEGTRFSAFNQVDTSNVAQLEVAWEYHTGDADIENFSQIQCNPIIVDAVMYGTSPQQKVFAIDASTGKEFWTFDPLSALESDEGRFVMNNTRGLSYWTDGKAKRIFFTAGPFLHSIDATTGRLDSAFGRFGKVDLHEGLGRDVSGMFITNTSPGVVYKDLLILGSRVDEGPVAAPGHIRAYNVRSGKQEWIFHTIPQPGEDGFESWEDPNAWKYIGGANCWSGFTLDEKRGIVFAPTGSASYDFYGGMRKGANLFADCVLALDAATGKRRWHFQQIHHDLWDRDLPTPPALVTVKHNGKDVDAVAQPTKTGYIFLLDRETGEPLFPVNELPVPVETDLAGEKVYPTQPVPVLPKPFVRQSITENDINDLVSPEEQRELKQKLATLNHSHMFQAPSKKGTVIFPGYDGGAEWGGPAFDPSTGIIYVNANEMPWILQMLDAKNEQPKSENWLQAGKRLYGMHCQSCHGVDTKGGGHYPSLLNMEKRYSQPQFDSLLLSGRRMMPSFQHLQEEERKAIASYILSLKADQEKRFTVPPSTPDTFRQLPYMGAGYTKFRTKDGQPAIRPPWGTLTAIDLNSGQHVWQIPLGEIPELKAKGHHTGTENYGGPVVTSGGLVFIAATSDRKMRAFNKRTGQLLWEFTLPASGFATPSVYEVSGRQYIVIACGGGKLRTKSGDSYVAFALPSTGEPGKK
ncbi:pyrroloquinoline quinone-dependent dehydrogenase [Flavihumibacter solisilvae]|uniref:Pyrrolo-quinoline quinone n=1 Tax=Flavihumibacter solisilvae TaxID=1349421 RepID=A0A0C1L0F9_9BACT|nr:pyrroloquinoline quinone-dependent dehydrogenase [Flavihumibacter solisilvae]KIC93472.1 pyrrolo-quinoline quinone [Flavihumibacter solisilvae]